MNLILGQTALCVPRMGRLSVQVFLEIVQSSVMDFQPAQMLGMSCFQPAKPKRPTHPAVVAAILFGNIETSQPAYTSARMVPGVLIGICFAMVSRIAQMEAMRAQLLARTSVSHIVQRVFLSLYVMKTAVFTGQWHAALRHSLYVRTVQICLTCAMASVTLASQ